MSVMVKVLIDDDILIQLGKQLEAQKKGEVLDCYFSIEEFLAAENKYSQDTLIQINSRIQLNEKINRFKNIVIYEETINHE